LETLWTGCGKPAHPTLDNHPTRLWTNLCTRSA
jgi:hypothetical protein